MDNEHRHRLAIVDCGTNTFTLHVARFEGRAWKSLFRQRRFVRLGHDSFRTGRISPDRFRRGLDVLSSFRETARNYGVTHVRAIGCSALRDASNGPDFVEAARQLGWVVNVIDGDQEAHWIQMGVADTVPPAQLGDDTAVTLDIGGGSVEMVVWNREAVLGRFSLDLGVARLTDWIKPSDPPVRKDIESLHRVADQAMAPFLDCVAQHPPALLVGTSGAFNTLAVLESEDAQWLPREQADVLPLSTLRSRCQALSTMRKDALARTPGIHPDRVPYMAIACALIDHILDRLPSVHTVMRSRYTVAEGLFVETAAQLSGGALPAGWVRLSALASRQGD